MPVPLILLPPSEGKSSGGDGLAWSKSKQSFPELETARKEVIKALKTAMKWPIEEVQSCWGLVKLKPMKPLKQTFR